MESLALAFRLARRELRGGLRGFRIFLACLLLGVASIAAVGSLSQAIVEGLRKEGRSLIGGDIELRLTHRPANDRESDYLARVGTFATLAQLRAMARVEGGDARGLVEVKAVDGLYPLYGELLLEPAEPLETLLADRGGVPGALVESNLLTRLGAKVGDRLRIGDGSFEIRGLVAREPDKGSEALALGPRVMVRLDRLERTGLVTTGSLVYWTYRLKLPVGTDAASVIERIKGEFPDAGWRIRDVANGAPALKQWIERITLFLTLIGLTALVVGGVGVGNAVRSYLDGKTQTIAVLKCVGAPGALIFRVYLLQALALALAGIVLGLLMGGLLPPAIAPYFANRLPVPPSFGFYPGPLILAAAYGLLVTLAFTLWPLARARDIPAARLFRDIVSPERRWPRAGYVAATFAAVAALVALSIATAEDKRFAVAFVLGAGASFLVLRGVGWGIGALARIAPRFGNPTLRLAIANLHRPGAATGSVVLSLGLGLTLLVAIALIEGNLSRQVEERLPEDAPAFFFIDIQPDQVEEFERTAASVPGAGRLDRVPSLRGRISRINGLPPEQVQINSDSNWALRGDRGLTYATRLPEGSSVVSGDWWPADYAGPPGISLDAKIAADFGLKVGDRLTVNVLGRDIEATILNLRRIDWSTLGINFAIVFAPGTLESAPHTHIATVQAKGAAEEALFRTITDRFPNVSAIRMKEALETVNKILEDISNAARGAAAVTLVAGVLMLAGAMAANHRRRLYDAVVMKVLGASRRQVMQAYLLEYALLGIATATVAAMIGSAAAWGVVRFVMRAEWTALPATMTVTALGAVSVTVLLGMVSTLRALSVRPAPFLRNL